MRRLSIALSAAALGSACASNTAELRTVPPHDETAVVAGEGVSPVVVELDRDHGVARGHLRWASSCRVVTLDSPLPRARGNVAASIALIGVVAAVSGVAGGALLANLDDFSSVEACSDDDDGECECSSPRDEAAGWGVLLVSGAVLLTGAAVAMPFMPEWHGRRVRDSARPRVLAEDVPCGEGALAELGVELFYQGERIATSKTDADGNVAFSVPASLVGAVTLAADSRLSRYALITPGERLGEVVLRAE